MITRLAIAGCALTLCQGCGIVREELNHSGGVIGHYADEWIDAHNKHWQVYRGAAAFAIISRVATYTVNDGKKAEIFWKSMELVRDDIYELNSLLDTECIPAAETDAPQVSPEILNLRRALESSLTCREQFEAKVPDLDEDLLQLAAFALPAESYDRLRAAWKSGISMSAIGSIVKAAGPLLQAGHGAAGVLRTELELRSAVCGVTLERLTYSTSRNVRVKCSAAVDRATIRRATSKLFEIVEDSCNEIRQKSVEKKKLGAATETWAPVVGECEFVFPLP